MLDESFDSIEIEVLFVRGNQAIADSLALCRELQAGMGTALEHLMQMEQVLALPLKRFRRGSTDSPAG